MIDKHYYVCPRDVALASAKHFATSSWIDLDETHVLLSVSPRGDRGREAFERHVTAEKFDANKHLDRIRKHPHFAKASGVDILDHAKRLHKGF
jgi:hypothetical protein